MPARNAPPRDEEERRVYTAEELESYRQGRAEAAQLYENPDMLTGFELTLQIFAASIVGNEIHVQVRATGAVERHEATAIAKGETVSFSIPAKVIQHGE